MSRKTTQLKSNITAEQSRMVRRELLIQSK
jgi:hypothetical protein